MLGSATHVANADRVYTTLQGNTDSPRHIQIENSKDDFVGSWIGGNPTTMKDRPKNTGWFGASMDIFGSDTSPHNCYGLANNACREVGYRPKRDDVMRPPQYIHQLKPNIWSRIYWQNFFLQPVYQPSQNNHGEKK